MREYEATCVYLISERKNLIYRYNMLTQKDINQIVNTKYYIKSHKSYEYQSYQSYE